jgi:hypothetical protein
MSVACGLFVLCGSALASSSRGISTQVSALASSPAARSLSSGLTTEGEILAARELAKSVLSGSDRTARSSDRHLARLTLFLLSPPVRQALAALDSKRGPTHAQAITLRRSMRVLTRSPVINQLHRAGQELHRHPARLRQLISSFFAQHGVRPVPGQKLQPKAIHCFGLKPRSAATQVVQKATHFCRRPASYSPRQARLSTSYLYPPSCLRP